MQRQNIEIEDEERCLMTWLGRLPFVSRPELTDIVAGRLTGIYGRLDRLKDRDLVTSREMGAMKTRQERWTLTESGVDLIYASDHQHPTNEERGQLLTEHILDPTARRLAQEMDLSHTHLPRLGDDGASPLPNAPDHSHVPWHTTEEGLEHLLARIPMLEGFYTRASTFLDSRYVQCLASGGGDLSEFRLLRKSSEIHAVAHYGEDIWVLFVWVGPQVTTAVLRRKWPHRLTGLHQWSEVEPYNISMPCSWSGPPDLSSDYTPVPSGIAVVAADRRAVEVTIQGLALEAESNINIWTPSGLEEGRCQLLSSRDFLGDPVSRARIGIPEQVGLLPEYPETKAEQRKARRLTELASLTGVLSYRVFSLIERWPGMLKTYLRKIVNDNYNDFMAALQGLVDAELVLIQDDRYYLAHRGMEYIAHRDLLSIL